MRVAEAFSAHGLPMAKAGLVTFSMHLRINLLATGGYITTFASSVLRLNADRFSLKVLPIDWPMRPWPVAIVTLKDRTLSPRRALLHLSLSYASPCGPAVLVTHDPHQTS